MSGIRDELTEERIWNGVTVAAAVLAGIAARNALEAAWRRTRREEPPKNPAASSVGWGEALVWTAAAGLTVGVARLVARRAVAAGWRRALGRDPEPLD